jgi:folate-dependent phosphoribosylglycinamide formyltransferase PurN
MISTKGDKFNVIISFLWKAECVINASVTHVQEMVEDTNGAIRSRKSKIPTRYSETVNQRYQRGNQKP